MKYQPKYPGRPRKPRLKRSTLEPCLDCSELEKAVQEARVASGMCRIIVECIAGKCRTIMRGCK